MKHYYLALVDGGVNPSEYSFDQLYQDYRTFGFGQFAIRFIGLFTGADMGLISGLMDSLTAFVDMHNLTPADMVTPVYGYF